MPNSQRPARPFSVPPAPKPGSPGWLDKRVERVERIVENRTAAHDHFMEVGRHLPQSRPDVITGGGGGAGPGGSSGNPYLDKIGAIAPANLIGWWRMNEGAGATVSLDSSREANHGAYTAVTLAQIGIGDGLTAASFDGATSKNNIYSAALNTDLGNGQEGTLALWAKVNATTDWTDGAEHDMAMFRVDGNNRFYFIKSTTNGNINCTYIAGGTVSRVDPPSQAGVAGWIHLAMTWSKSGDAFKAYLNGVQTGSTQTGLGTFAGALSSTQTLLGAATTTPTLVWSGFLAHAMLWTTPLTAAQVLQLATVP